jgi:hypothetical protein
MDGGGAHGARLQNADMFLLDASLLHICAFIEFLLCVEHVPDVRNKVT